jgi:hypothetical protein
VIDILIPVLGRPHNAAPLVDNIRSVTSEPHTIWFLCTPGDTAQIEAAVSSGADYVHVMDFPAGPADYARKINHAFIASGKVGSSEWVFMGADDLWFEKNWDWTAIKAAGRKHNVVGTNDLANAQVRKGVFGTHCLIRRRYVTEQGGTAAGTGGDVLWEGYDHNFVDRELCHVAQHRRCYISATHSRVRHRHPLWRTAPNDPTYVKALAKFRQDQRLFLSRAHLWGYVGLSAQERKLAA